jgi:hypothetical protein
MKTPWQIQRPNQTTSQAWVQQEKDAMTPAIRQENTSDNLPTCNT